MTLYLLDKQDNIFKLPFERTLQSEVEVLLQNQYYSFIQDAEFTEFQGSYKTQKGELNTITEYTLPENISEAIANPTNVEILDLDSHIQPKAIFAEVDIDGIKIVVFQKIDSRQILDTSYSFIQSREVFSKLEDRVLTLQTKIVAAFRDDGLLFSSFSQVRSILPVVQHYEEATKGDIDDFVDQELFVFTDEVKFRGGLSPLTRKKIKMIKDAEILENTSSKSLKKQAQKYGIDLKFNDTKQLVFPKKVGACKEIISFLNEEYATAILTKRKIKMNSKKYLD